MTAIVDPVAAIRSILLADTTVAALVGAEGVVSEIDEDIAPAMPKQIIVLKPSGGPRSPGGGDQQFGAQRLDVICYAATLYDSWTVYLAAYGALKAIRRKKVNGVLIHGAAVESKGSTARDVLKQWPVTYSSWLVTAAEIAAA